MRNKRRSEEDSGRNRTEEKTIMKTIAIYNIKGGDGKTTTAKHLAVGLAKKGIRILLADADGQANCSKSFILKNSK